MLFATSHNFILIGSFTALLYIGALFLFRKSEKLKIVKQELHHKACINISQIRINKSVNT